MALDGRNDSAVNPDAPDRVALGRLAEARGARARAGPATRSAPARRADQPPRRRGDRGAGGVAGARAVRDPDHHPRPPLPAAGGDAHPRARSPQRRRPAQRGRRLRRLHPRQGRADARPGATRDRPAQHAAARDRMAASRRCGAQHQAAGAHPARRHPGRRGDRARPPQPVAHRHAGLSVVGAPSEASRRSEGRRPELRRPDDLPGGRSLSRSGLAHRAPGAERLRQIDADPGPAGRRGAVRGDRPARRRPQGRLLPADPRRARSGRAPCPTRSAPTATSSVTAARACTSAATSNGSSSRPNR